MLMPFRVFFFFCYFSFLVVPNVKTSCVFFFLTKNKQALQDNKLKPPFPKQAPLDNVFKFSRLLPKCHVFEKQSQASASPSSPPTAGSAFPAVASGHGNSITNRSSSEVGAGKPKRGGDEERPQPPHPGGGIKSNVAAHVAEDSASVRRVAAGGGKHAGEVCGGFVLWRGRGSRLAEIM